MEHKINVNYCACCGFIGFDSKAFFCNLEL